MKRKLATAGLVSPLPVWLAYVVAGRGLAAALARRWGAQMVRAGDGKFADAAVFLQHRFCEAAWLWTLGVVVVALVLGLGVLAARRLPQLWRWVPFTVTGFVGLNVWVGLAMNTCLFWCLFWNGKATTDNFTQFNIKLRLMNESTAPVKTVLGGSSQTRTQIDPRLLNQQLSPEMFTMELHFPGSVAYDFLLLDQKLAGQKVDILVCYLSELNFFAGAVSDGFAYLSGLGDLPQFLRFGGKVSWRPRAVGYAWLGDMLPVFRLRDGLAYRLLGCELASVRQREEDTALGRDLQRRAVAAKGAYRSGPQSEFNFAAFEFLVARCRAEHRLVVVCQGQLNPIQARELDPALRPLLESFLRRLAAQYDNVVLVGEPPLPAQTEADYEDLTHVNTEARARYTEALAPVLSEVARRGRGVK